MDFSDTIEVKVVDKEPHFAVDSYFFAYFHDLPGALDQIRDAVRVHRTIVDETGTAHPHELLDTTTLRPQPTVIERAASMPNPTDTSKEKSSSSSGFRISSILKPFQDSRSSSTISPSNEEAMEEFTHISKRTNSFVPVASTGSPSSATPTQSTVKAEHTYPPSTLSDPSSLLRESTSSSSGITASGSTWSVSVPSWLKGTRTRALFSVGSSEPAPVKEVYSSSIPTNSKWSSTGDMAFSVLDTPEMTMDQEIVDRFRAAFAYDEKETLLGCEYHNYLGLCLIPHQLFLATFSVCYRSMASFTSLPITSASNHRVRSPPEQGYFNFFSLYNH